MEAIAIVSKSVGHTVQYENHIRLPSEKLKHQVCDIVIAWEDADNYSIDIDLGGMGMAKLHHLNVQPLGEHFSVVWNGDRSSPRLIFDGAPLITRIRAECWGA